MPDASGKVLLVGAIVRSTPYGAEVKFEGHRPIWCPACMLQDLGRTDVVVGGVHVFTVSASWATERGLLDPRAAAAAR